MFLENGNMFLENSNMFLVYGKLFLTQISTKTQKKSKYS